LSDDFVTLINSLGRMAFDRLRREHLVEIFVRADEQLRTVELVARMEHEPDDEEYRRLLQELIDVRRLFLDRLTVSVAVETGDSGVSQDAPQVPGTREFAYTG
jgi:hypothetical protein